MHHHNLIDELRLMVSTLDRRGIEALLRQSEIKKFELKHSGAINNGDLILDYQPIM